MTTRANTPHGEDFIRDDDVERLFPGADPDRDAVDHWLLDHMGLSRERYCLMRYPVEHGWRIWKIADAVDSVMDGLKG